MTLGPNRQNDDKPDVSRKPTPPCDAAHPKVSLTTLGWLFTLAVLAHNLEEALHLPAWSLRAGRVAVPVRPRVFRWAVAWLSLGFVAATAAASVSAPASLGAYLMAGYVLAMVLNVFVPHLAASALTRSYMPGTGTALLLNLPLGLLYLHRAVASQSITLPTFYWAGPLVVLGIAGVLPALFALGRKRYPAGA